MSALLSFNLDEQWGMVFILLVGFLCWKQHLAISHFRFEKKLISMNLPNTRRGWWAAKFLAGGPERNLIGQTFIFSQSQIAVGAVAFVLFCLIAVRAFLSHHALEIARGGALISVSALVSVYWGYKEEKRLDAEWGRMAKKASSQARKLSIQQQGNEAINAARSRSQSTAFYVAVAGTILWAYGDQFMGCGVFHWSHIKDESGVSCFHAKTD